MRQAGNMIEKELEDKINLSVYQQFPYLEDVEPEIKQTEKEKILLIYKGQVKTASGHPLPVTIRVVADRTGKIIKLTTSR